MDEKTNRKLNTIAVIVTVVIVAAAALFVGKSWGEGRLIGERDRLRALNRASVENMIIEESPVYVIGHMSPDSDTVVGAIAYARLLTELGYPAEPAVTMEINNETKWLLKEAGADVPKVLNDVSGMSIFLVDHSEYAQAAEGVEDAHIVGVIDHHGVGTLITGNQVVYEGRPIGSTATIIWLDYLNYGVEIDKTTAYLMLGAVLSDTDGLTGSTTTEADRQAVEELSKTAGVKDAMEMYRKLHEEKLSYEGFTDLEILFSDYKEYEVEGKKFGIGLVNAIDDETAEDLAARMKEALKEGTKMKDVDYLYASVGIRENGEKIDRIVPGDDKSREVFLAAFPENDGYDGTSFLFKKGLGRKTKFVPAFTDFLMAYPHE